MYPDEVANWGFLNAIAEIDLRPREMCGIYDNNQGLITMAFKLNFEC